MKSMFFLTFVFVSYSGNNNTLKQVCAVGKWSLFAFFWIMKFKDFKPYNGTLSLPVQNTKNAFFSSRVKSFNTLHKYLYLFLST